jgi:hypothetical protein
VKKEEKRMVVGEKEESYQREMMVHKDVGDL